MRKLIISAAAMLAALPVAAQPVAKETAIPFVSSNGIHDWRADGKRALFIQSINGDWYYARTAGVCGRLLSARALGVETSALNQLDRYGAVLVEGGRCQLASVVR